MQPAGTAISTGTGTIIVISSFIVFLGSHSIEFPPDAEHFADCRALTDGFQVNCLYDSAAQ